MRGVINKEPDIDFSAYVRYDAESGLLYWKDRGRNCFGTDRAYNIFKAKCLGKEAGHKSLGPSGRPTDIVVWVSGLFRVRAHRVIWIMHHGPIPEGMVVDHIDGNPFNNKLSNLRLATRSQNNANRRVINSRSGLKGVFVDKPTGRWVASITVSGKCIRLGRFHTKGLAAVAYAKAAMRHHGSFHKVSSLTIGPPRNA